MSQHKRTTKLLSRSQALCFMFILGFLVFATSKASTQHTIDFSESTNLKALYDAGLRPWRVRPDERRSLTITNEMVRIIAPGSSQLTLDVEIASFSVMAENDLGRSRFISQPIPLAEAGEVAREACRALNIDMNVGAGMEGFDEKYSEMSSLGDQMPAPQYWNGRGIVGGIRTGVTLNPLFGIRGVSEPRGKVYVTFIFHEPGEPMEFLTGPIKPPPGYEDVSMERPETNSREPFPDPAYSMDAVKERMEGKRPLDAPL